MLPGGNAVAETMPAKPMLPGGNAVVETMPAKPMLPEAMLALRQCRCALRVYDAVRRPCCPLDNADIASMPLRFMRV